MGTVREKKKKTHRRSVIAGITLLALIISVSAPFSRYPFSLLVMKIYSGFHQRQSLMEKKGIDLTLPGGSSTRENDWYPFVMVFNSDKSFSAFAGEKNLRLTILYNFPSFDLKKGCSRIYDPNSPYYCGFYGAYLISGRSREGLPYGFSENGNPDLEAVSQIIRFDYQDLVLRDFGIEGSKQVFDWTIIDMEEGLDYAGSGGWTRVDANLTVNGLYHKQTKFRRSYLQYGSPADFPDRGNQEPFAPVKLRGRIYGKYFKQWDTGIFFYVLAGENEVLAACDKILLSQSEIARK